MIKRRRSVAKIKDDAEQFKSACRELVTSYRDDRAWHALLCWPGQDRNAAKWLVRERRAIYWPNVPKRIDNKFGTRRSVDWPMIPGYVFLARAIDHAQGGDDYLRECRFVIGYLRSAGKRALLSELDIQALRLIEADQNLPQAIAAGGWLPKPGESVRFTMELWRDRAGVVVEVASAQRIGIEVELLGRRVKIYVSSSQIAVM